MTRRFLNTSDIAIYLSLSEHTIRSWVKRGLIPFFKFGAAVRFDLTEIEKWARKRKCSNNAERKKGIS